MNKVALSALSALLLSSCSSVPLSGEAYDAVSAGSLNGYRPVSDYELGKRNLSAHNYGNAITAFLRELERDPNSVATLNGLAIAYHEIGREDLASDFWERALSVDPESQITLNNLAYFNLKRGDNETALAFATQAQTQAMAAENAGAQPSIVSVISNNIAAASGQPLQSLSAPNEVVLSATEEPKPVNGVERIDDRQWQLRTTAADAEAAPAETVRIAAPTPSDLPTIVTSATGAARVEAPEAAPQPTVAAPTIAEASPSVPTEPQVALVQEPAEELQLRTAEKPSILPPVEPQPDTRDDPTRPGTTLAELAGDPTVLMQRLPSEEPGLAASQEAPAEAVAVSLSPDVASSELANDAVDVASEDLNAAQSLESAAPSIVPTAKPVAVSQPVTVVQTRTLEELSDDPTVMMQHLPNQEAEPVQISQPSSATQAFSIPSEIAVKEPATDLLAAEVGIDESLPAIEPSFEAAAVQEFVAQPNSVTQPRSFEELANDPTVMIQRLPLYEPDYTLAAQAEPLAQESESSLIVTFKQPANLEESAPQSFASVESSIAPEVEAPFAAPARSAARTMTFEELANDPTVVIQRLQNSDTGTLPSIVTDAGSQRNLTRPALRPEITNDGQSETTLLRYAATVQALIDNPAIVVQRLPGYEPQLREPIQSDTAGDTGTLNPALSAEAPTSEPTASLQSETDSNLYLQSSFLPAADRFRLRISNGAGSEDLANRFASFISERGFIPDYVRNASTFDYEQSYVFYNPGLLATAQKIAEMIPVPVKLVEASQGSGSVEVILGSDLIGFDGRL